MDEPVVTIKQWCFLEPCPRCQAMGAKSCAGHPQGVVDEIMYEGRRQALKEKLAEVLRNHAVRPNPPDDRLLTYLADTVEGAAVLMLDKVLKKMRCASAYDNDPLRGYINNLRKELRGK